MTTDSVLVYLEDCGYCTLVEGDGSNLFDSDVEDGFVDYIMYDEYDSLEDVNEGNSRDGAQIMLTNYYQDMFNSADDVVKYVIDTGFMPCCNYEIIKEG